MGTGSKAVHQPATISPAAPPSPGPSPASPVAAGNMPAHTAPPPPASQPSMGNPAASAAGDLPSPVPAPAPVPPAEPSPQDLGPQEPAAAAVTPPPAVPPGTELTPIPDVVPGDAPAGVPVLVGGDNLTGSTATLMSYVTPAGPREVLLATVTEESEPVLLEALKVSATTLVPVHVQETVQGRLSLDTERQLHERVAKAARSVNHKLKSQTAIPEHTVGYYDDARAAVQAVLDDASLSGDEKKMAAYYGSQLDEIAARLDPSFATPYDQGGRIPQAGAYEHSGVATVTRQVMQPASPGDLQPGQHPAVVRDAGRIKASLDPVTGLTSWDGTSRRPALGQEYVADLGGGWTVVYRPYAANDPHKHEYSLRGQLEMHAPPGAGHGRDLTGRLASINLSAHPMTHADAEWAYLRANIAAQGLGGHQAVTSALVVSGSLQEMEMQEIFHARQHDAASLSGQSLDALARQIELQAASRSLPKKLSLLRDAVAQAVGFADGQALATSPGYDPVPKRSGGWLTWGRFDVTSPAGAAKLRQAWSGKTLVHSVTGSSSMADILATGVLAATERRAVMGIAPGIGTSEDSDKKSGGANSVFLRVKGKSPGSSRAFIWDNPAPLLSRADYYAYSGDHFGSLNPASGHPTQGMTRDPLKIAGFGGSTNEVMISNGIDLLGHEAPGRIVCASSAERNAVLAMLSSRGISHLGGKAVTDVVTF